MKLINITKNKYIAKDLEKAEKPLDKFLGLHIRSNSRSQVFKTRFGIHTMFLKTPIDVIVLNNKMEVKKLRIVKPNSIFLYNPKYKIVIELPPKTIQKTKTEIGDKLKMLK